MTEESIKEGVVVEYEGKYWGLVEENSYGWTTLLQAKISDPKYTHHPTSLTYTPRHYPHSEYQELAKGVLVKVRLVTTIQTLPHD